MTRPPEDGWCIPESRLSPISLWQEVISGEGEAGDRTELGILHSVLFELLLLLSLFFFFGYLHGTWKYPGQGSNPSQSFGLCHGFGNAKSLTHCATVGTLWAPYICFSLNVQARSHYIFIWHLPALREHRLFFNIINVPCINIISTLCILSLNKGCLFIIRSAFIGCLPDAKQNEVLWKDREGMGMDWIIKKCSVLPIEIGREEFPSWRSGNKSD